MNSSSAKIRVGGFTPLTTIDYPDHLSCVIFCQGCPWRCHYCHNPDLVGRQLKSGIESNTNTLFSWDSICDFLKRRKGLLDAVVFSGGEPLAQKHLTDAIVSVKELGFKVGLHTSGANTAYFKQQLSLVDWVGYDVKALPDKSTQVTQRKGSFKSNWSSLTVLLSSNVTYQCRTTIHPSLLTSVDITALCYTLSARGVKNYLLQIANTVNTLSPLPALTYPKTKLDELRVLGNRLFENFSIT